MENETKPTDTTSDDSIMMLLRDNSREKSDTSSFELKNLIIVVNDLTTRVQFLENEDKELTQQVETLSVKFEKSDQIKIQNDIETITETELSKSIELG